MPIAMNHYLYKNGHDMRILALHKLNDSRFDCRRWSKERHYVYRMIGSSSHRQIELFEGRYAHVREQEIKLDRYKRACEMFVG